MVINKTRENANTLLLFTVIGSGKIVSDHKVYITPRLIFRAGLFLGLIGLLWYIYSTENFFTKTLLPEKTHTWQKFSDSESWDPAVLSLADQNNTLAPELDGFVLPNPNHVVAGQSLEQQWQLITQRIKGLPQTSDADITSIRNLNTSRWGKYEYPQLIHDPNLPATAALITLVMEDIAILTAKQKVYYDVARPYQVIDYQSAPLKVGSASYPNQRLTEAMVLGEIMRSLDPEAAIDFPAIIRGYIQAYHESGLLTEADYQGALILSEVYLEAFAQNPDAQDMLAAAVIEWKEITEDDGDESEEDAFIQSPVVE